ncbi:MAG: UDP-N-acetylmuramoyl-L-alanine--D-glutamate ligase [Zoogloeaceae bacterium]|jgi:UDP-N-acetylmuramoylalanine--D-glutamate ligase|nr:UDP-N-acetylmuramoyl-L-alanine--D-glutamate ligase [Zoogloeaceae bacterium]
MELANKHFLVLGLGESGLAMARWLDMQGAQVTVADSRAEPPGLATLRAELPDIPVVTGPFPAEGQTQTVPDFSWVIARGSADAIALSPGLSPNLPELVASGLPVFSEVDFFAAALAELQPDAITIAITGTNGKTTTTALTAHLLNRAGISAVACGNISPSLLDALMAALACGNFPKVWVAELSSFQLESTQRLPLDAATVLNVNEDHLDRYPEGIAAYANAKARIFRESRMRVVNRDDDWSLSMGGLGTGMTTFGLDSAPRAGHYGYDEGALWLGKERLVAARDLPLQGTHNIANIMAALALCRAVGVPAERALPGLASFRGLPHRVEPVAEIDGILYVDDSKGTNVGATLAALRGMGRPVALLLGGDGKGQDFTPLKAALTRHGRAVALIGKDGPTIGQVIAGCGLPVESFPNLEDAVAWLAGKAQRGDCVLLSPACASWDMFADYSQRAAAFVRTVAAIQTGGAA